MIYRLKLFGLLFNRNKHLYPFKKAAKILYSWKGLFLLFIWLLVYAWMSWLGLGTAQLAPALDPAAYELAKLWFLTGRLLYALLFAFVLLLLPSSVFSLLFKVPFKKTFVLQQAVLLILIIERISWIPLFTYQGLQWQLSPLSFGPVAAFFGAPGWVIYGLGAVSLFQLWIIYFQASSITYLSGRNTYWVWTTVILLHLLYWTGTAALVSLADELLSFFAWEVSK